MNKNLGIAAFGLLLIVSLSGCTGLTVGPSFPSWLGISVIAIIISFLVVSITYMAGSFFDLPDLIAWARNEMFQTAAVALMLSMFFVFYSFLDIYFIPSATPYVPGGPYRMAGAVNVACGATNNVYCGAINYLQTLLVFLSGQFSSLLFLNLSIGFFQDMVLRVMPAGIGFMVNVGVVLIPFAHFLGTALELLSFALWAVNIQIQILLFSSKYMLALFLPLGIVFRSFPFTRAVGGALIAISIGFAVIYPLTFLIDLGIFENHYPAFYTSCTTGPHICAFPSTITDFDAWVTQFAKGDLYGIKDPSGNDVILNNLQMAWFMLKALFSMFFSRLLFPFAILINLIKDKGIMEDVFYSVIVYTIILPIVNVFITLTFVRGFAQVMGSDINLSSITKMI